MTPTPTHRPDAAPVRFFGRRSGRKLRPGRQDLVETLLPRLRVPVTDADRVIEPAALFDGCVREVWLEIGFGAGEHLLAQAAAHPEVGLIGCEPYRNGVATLLTDVAATGIQNVRIFDDDARLLLERLAPARIARVFVLFSDPWPKKRHWSRRLISASTLNALARVMADCAELRFASDEMSYVRWTLDHFERHPCFGWSARTARDWRDPPADGVETRYQAKARSRGRRCVHLDFVRYSRLIVGEKPL